MPRRSGAIDERPSASSNSGPSPITGHEKTSRCFSLVYALLKTQQTAPERKRNASEADKQQANKEQTIVIRTAGGSTCSAATRLLGKPGLLHTSHSEGTACTITRYNEIDKRDYITTIFCGFFLYRYRRRPEAFSCAQRIQRKTNQTPMS